METFKVNKCDEDGIDLKSEKQMESLLALIKDSTEVRIKWKEDIEETDHADAFTANRCKILMTDGLIARIKDGRFSITSTEEAEE